MLDVLRRDVRKDSVAKNDDVTQFEKRGNGLLGIAIAVGNGSDEVIIIGATAAHAARAAKRLGCKKPDESRMKAVVIIPERFVKD